MKALVYQGPGKMALQDQPVPQTHTVNTSDGKAVEKVKQLTAGRGVDTAIEAVGIPATFGLCQEIVAAGGTIANIA
jgi:alcohol dehydrogenase